MLVMFVSFFFLLLFCSYTLRNAEYRLCLQKSLGACDDDEAGCWHGDLSTDYHKQNLNNENRVSENGPQHEESSFPASNPCEDFNNAQQWTKDDIKEIEMCRVMSEEARKYIQNLKGKLISVTKVCISFGLFLRGFALCMSVCFLIMR
jgi:hypothetical protein